MLRDNAHPILVAKIKCQDINTSGRPVACASTDMPGAFSDTKSEMPVVEPLQVLPAKPGGRSRAWKISLAGLLLAAAIGTGVFYYLHQSQTPEYITARIDRGDIDSTVNTTGNLNAVITVQVGSQVSGNIIALYADFNTKVTKGQLVAEIDPAPFKAAVEQATATLNAANAAIVTARAGLAKSQSDLAAAQANVVNQRANVAKAQSASTLAAVETDRRKTMLKTGSTSQEDADIAQANYEQSLAGVDAAQAAVRAAQAAADSAAKSVEVARTQIDQARAIVEEDRAVLSQAQLNLSHTRILAPVDGTVESRNMDRGQTVAASFQAPVIFLIAQDLTKMQVDTNVDEADVGAVRLGQPATFTVDAYPGTIFHGTVAQIREAPINVQNVITYDVVVAVSNPDLKLFPGMTANVTILSGHVSRVLRIPKAALRFHPRGQPSASATGDAGSTVFILDRENRPQPARITPGLASAGYVEARGGGLVEGQQVITGTAVKGRGTASPVQRSAKKLGF